MKDNNKTSINFVGDICLFSKYEDESIDPLDSVRLPVADYSIANFEFVQPRDDTKKAFFNVEEKFRCSYSYFKSLNLGKFNAYGLANNHIMDYGRRGLNDMAAVFDKQNIEWFGVSEGDADKLLEFVVNDISFLVIGGASSGRWSKEALGYGAESAEQERLLSLINDNVLKYDHVIVFLHWGSELVDLPPPENVKKSLALIDAGVRAVIGHHPHVPQGIQKYKNGLIAHSLGSFIFLPDEVPGYEPGHLERELSIVLNIEFDKTSIVSFRPEYYKYSSDTLLPETIQLDLIKDYINGINADIGNVKEYTSKLRNILLKREIKLFVERFKKKPIPTIIHYINYLGFKHIKKLVGM